MATLLFTAVGTLIGGPVGGAIGAIAGRQIDAQLLGGGNRQGPRLTELAVTSSSYGMAIPRQFGRVRVAGQIIWATDLVEHHNRHSNGKGKPSTTEYSYTASFAVALSSRRVLEVGRIWADGKLLRGAADDLKTGGSFRLHSGEGDQRVDALLAAAEANGQCPAYTGLAYAVFEDLQLGDFGNRIPALTFEIVADTTPLTIDTLLDGVIAEVDAAVPLDGLTGMSCDGTTADTLSALEPIFPVDCDACDARLAIRPDRHQTAPILLPEAATSTEHEDFGGNAGFSRKRAAETEQPIAVLRYYDVDRDFQPGVQRAAGRPLPGQPRTVELPAALTASAARALVAQTTRRMQWARQTLSWRVTQLDPAVRPGTTVSLPDHPGLWRVRDWEWRSHGVDLTLVRLAPTVDGAVAGDPGRAGTAPDLAVARTVLAVCEVPWDGNSSSPVPMVIAAVSSPQPQWSGASLYVNQGDGALKPLGTSGRSRATIGTSDDALPARSPLLFDRHGFVTVTLAGPDLVLSDATMRQLAMGANRAVLGAEILQFASAQPLGSGKWKLSGLWRGLGGTEAMVASHAPGEAFILLDGTGTALDDGAVGSVPGSTIAAIGLADPAPVTASILLRGIGLRPPAPVHGQCSGRADGGLDLQWTRRARGAWFWQDSVDTPLNEQAEAYEVIFGPASAPLARWETTVPTLTVPAVQAAALRTAAPAGAFAIRQR
ncbi:MAG: phage tail protein, partial [Sphingomonadales bacterium]|nr:phage tail protein [Sphingomonadales bacterium]